MQLADMVLNIRLALQCSKFAQILADCAAVAADGIIQRMTARDEHDAAAFNGTARTVFCRQQAGIHTDGNLLVHGAVGRGHVALIPVVRDGLVTVHVVIAGVGRQLAADAAGRYAHETVVGGRAVNDLSGVEPLRLVNLLHKALPQRRGCIAAGRLAGKRFVVVVTDPHGGGVPACHAGEEHALGIGVGAGLAGDDLRGNLRLGAGAALHGFLEHIRNQIGCGRLEYLMAILLLMHVDDDVAVVVKDSGEGQRLLIDALVGNGAECNSHLHRRDAGGTQRQTERIGVDVLVLNAHELEIADRAGNADVAHENLRSGGVVRIAQRVAEALRALIAAAAVVLRPCVLAGGILPAGDRNGHVVGDGRGRCAKVDRRGVDRQRLDGGADGHVHVAGTVERLAGSRLVAAADNRLELACAIVVDDGGGLRLLDLGIGAVGVARLIDLVRWITQTGIIIPAGQRILKNGLHLGIQTKVDAVTACAQFVFHCIAVS